MNPDLLINAKSIFNKATGFIQRGGFVWTCNPYLGCTFGCLYCYAMFLPQNKRPKEEWGQWVQAKNNAVELAEKQASKLANASLYMSSVTDPYLPLEKSLELTRGLLQVLLPHQPRLLVQTRGPLLVRDLDLFQQFDCLRVNISIPTDSEDVRKVFEPKAPPLQKRWQAAEELRAAGVAVGLCITPMLPLDNDKDFVAKLVSFEPDVLVVQDFHASLNGFGANTAARARQLAEERHWNHDKYFQVKTMLSEQCEVFEGEKGFFPPPLKNAC